jgi:chemotaxis-related protein WspB
MIPTRHADGALMLLFSVGEIRYALPCRDVVHVLALPRLQPTPGAPGAAAGAFLYRGELLPVIDLCRLMLGTGCPPLISSRVVVVRTTPEAGSRPLGLLAEKVTEARCLASAPVQAEQGTAEYVAGVIAEDGALFRLLDVSALARRAGLESPSALAG